MEWIKTEDGMPEIDEFAFFYYGGKTPVIGCYKVNGTFFEMDNCGEMWTMKEDGISHWMKLPEPPNN